MRIKIIQNKTGVIHDPRGKTHNLACSDHCFQLQVVLFCTNGWHKQWSLPAVIMGRADGSISLYCNFEMPHSTDSDMLQLFFQAWLVMISSFLFNGIIFGITNSFGVIFVYLKKEMGDDPNSASKASLVGSLAVGATFLLSPVSGILADKFGIKRTALFGSCLATLGMLLSSFSVNRVWQLIFFDFMIART